PVHLGAAELCAALHDIDHGLLAARELAQDVVDEAVGHQGFDSARGLHVLGVLRGVLGSLAAPGRAATRRVSRYSASTCSRAHGVRRRNLRLEAMLGSWLKQRMSIRRPSPAQPKRATRSVTMRSRVRPWIGFLGCAAVIGGWRVQTDGGADRLLKGGVADAPGWRTLSMRPRVGGIAPASLPGACLPSPTPSPNPSLPASSPASGRGAPPA